MKKWAKMICTVIFGIPIAFLAYLLWVGVIDVVMTIVIGLLIIPFVIACILWVVYGLYEIIKSIFIKDKGTDERGFKRF